MSDLRLASPWFRLAGWMVDFLLWMLIWLGLVWLVVSVSDVMRLLDSLLWAVAGLGLLGILGIIVLRAGFTHWFGGTIGKLVFGMEVVGKNGKRLSFRQSVWREWFGSWVSGMALWLGFVWIFIDKERRGWHDMMVGSRVVVKRPGLAAVGVLVLALILVLNIWLGRKVADKAVANLTLYQQIAEEISASLDSAD